MPKTREILQGLGVAQAAVTERRLKRRKNTRKSAIFCKKIVSHKWVKSKRRRIKE